jgi:hypothetical protein
MHQANQKMAEVDVRFNMMANSLVSDRGSSWGEASAKEGSEGRGGLQCPGVLSIYLKACLHNWGLKINF